MDCSVFIGEGSKQKHLWQVFVFVWFFSCRHSSFLFSSAFFCCFSVLIGHINKLLNLWQILINSVHFIYKHKVEVSLFWQGRKKEWHKPKTIFVSVCARVWKVILYIWWNIFRNNQRDTKKTFFGLCECATANNNNNTKKNWSKDRENNSTMAYHIAWAPNTYACVCVYRVTTTVFNYLLKMTNWFFDPNKYIYRKGKRNEICMSGRIESNSNNNIINKNNNNNQLVPFVCGLTFT